MPEKLIVLSFLTTIIIMILFRGSRVAYMDEETDLDFESEAEDIHFS